MEFIPQTLTTFPNIQPSPPESGKSRVFAKDLQVQLGARCSGSFLSSWKDSGGVVGRIRAPKDTQILLPGTCEFMLHSTEELRL